MEVDLRKYYSLKSHGIECLAIIDNFNIYIGDIPSYKKCVILNIVDNIIVIENVSHYLFASMFKPRSRNKNSTSVILRASIEFAHQLFPQTTLLQVEDHSYIFDRSGKCTNLANQCYLLYGKTWYQLYLAPLKLYVTDSYAKDRVKEYDIVLKNYEKYKDEFATDIIYQKCKSWFEYFSCYKKLTKTVLNNKIRRKHLYFDVIVQIKKHIFNIYHIDNLLWTAKLIPNLINIAYESIEKPSNLIWNGKIGHMQAGPYDPYNKNLC